MKKQTLIVFLLALTLLQPWSCSRHDREELLVFSGAASKPAIEEIAEIYKEKTGTRVQVNVGGSGSLLAQIEMSGQGDVYIPGSPDYIEIANEKELIYSDSVEIIAYLVPGIIVPAGNPAGIKSLHDLTRPGIKVGIGNPESVCLGLYSLEILEHNNLLEEVLANTATYAASCSKTANLAVFKRVDAVLGWRVFKDWNPGELEHVGLKSDQIPRLAYIPASIPVHTRNRVAAQKFIDFLLSETGREIYAKYGYISSREEARSYSPDAAIGGQYKIPEIYYRLIHE